MRIVGEDDESGACAGEVLGSIALARDHISLFAWAARPYRQLTAAREARVAWATSSPSQAPRKPYVLAQPGSEAV